MSLLGGIGFERNQDHDDVDRRVAALTEVIAMQQQEIMQLRERIAGFERNDQAQMREIMRLRRAELFKGEEA